MRPRAPQSDLDQMPPQKTALGHGTEEGSGVLRRHTRPVDARVRVSVEVDDAVAVVAETLSQRPHDWKRQRVVASQHHWHGARAENLPHNPLQALMSHLDTRSHGCIAVVHDSQHLERIDAEFHVRARARTSHILGGPDGARSKPGSRVVRGSKIKWSADDRHVRTRKLRRLQRERDTAEGQYHFCPAVQ